MLSKSRPTPVVISHLVIFHLVISVAPPSRLNRVMVTVLKGALIGAVGYACYRAGGSLGRALLSLPSVKSLLETVKPPPPA